MRDKKIVSIDKYISKKNKLEIDRKELIKLIRKVMSSVKNENIL